MTFDQVKQLSLYEKRLLLGYQPVVVLDMSKDSGEPDQPKRKKGEWLKQQKVTNG